MVFENLTDRLQQAFRQLTGKGKLTEKDVKAALREVKLALLEADVNFRIVKDFIKNVTEKAVGEEVLEGLNPGQQVIKIVRDELIDVMGTTQSKLTFSSKSPTVYMMVGLQGAGKTTSAGKLAGQLKKQGKRPLLTACDIYRPAAIKQLQVVGDAFGIPVFEQGQTNPVEIAKNSIDYAKANGHDIVIIDTAGRLHINEELMEELANIKRDVRPQEILLVIDAMTGQDAVNVAKTFDEKLGIDGTIITKLDGDTRGGAAISVRSVTGKPIKYVGMGEKLEDLEPFYPDRMVSRILGMGDVLTLIDKAQTAFDEKQVQELERKMRSNDFNLEDFLNQMQQVRKMGPIKDLLGMLPGMNKINLGDADIDEKALVHIEAIIQSMTVKERQNPELLNGSRKRRIAKGSGRSIQEINQLLKQFNQVKDLMKMMGGAKKRNRLGGLKLPFM